MALALCEINDRIATVTINNPPLNALDVPTKMAIRDVFLELDDRRDEILAVILTGSGEKAFAAGADIKAFLELEPETAKRRLTNSHLVYGLVENFVRPVIAAIRGYCFGGGLELALCADFRYSATGAVFGFPEVKLGVFPGNGGTARARHVLGLGRFKEMVYSGSTITAAQAREYGLVERLFPEGELMEASRKMALTIAKRGPLAVAAAKKVINRGRNMPLTQSLELESDLWAGLTASRDMKEGARAFLEKRKPDFRGL